VKQTLPFERRVEQEIRGSTPPLGEKAFKVAWEAGWSIARVPREIPPPKPATRIPNPVPLTNPSTPQPSQTLNRWNNCFAELCSGLKEGSYSRRIGFCITQL
jgi:hypothetical protein